MPDLKAVLSHEIDASSGGPVPPVGLVLRRVQDRQRRRRVAAAGLGVAALVVLAAAVPRLVGDGSATAPDGARGGPAASAVGASSPGDRSGPVAMAGTYGCLGGYSPEAVAAVAIVFDGTISQVEASSEASGEQRSDVQTVSFVVNRSYRGGVAQGDEVRLTMFRPEVTGSVPSYGVGSRLLVSASASGDSTGVTGSVLPCGFTRYYDEATASQWAGATG